MRVRRLRISAGSRAIAVARACTSPRVLPVKNSKKRSSTSGSYSSSIRRRIARDSSAASSVALVPPAWADRVVVALRGAGGAWGQVRILCGRGRAVDRVDLADVAALEGGGDRGEALGQLGLDLRGEGGLGDPLAGLREALVGALGLLAEL